jgi:hypothetical protein
MPNIIEQDDVFTLRQDMITDILLKTYKAKGGGLDAVKAMLRLAVSNFAEECSEDNSDEVINILSEGVKTPLYLHD